MGVGERPEQGGGDAGLVRHPPDRDLRLVLGEGDAGDNLAFHDFLLVADECPGRNAMGIDVFGPIEARAHEDAHPALHGKLDRAHLQDIGAERGHLQHFLVGDPFQAPGFLLHVRIGRIDPVDVGIDIAAFGMDRRRNGDGAGIGAAAAERGDAAGLLVDALEAGNDRDLAIALLEALDDFGAIDLEDARGAVGIVSIDRQLPALPGTRAHPHVLQHDR